MTSSSNSNWLAFQRAAPFIVYVAALALIDAFNLFTGSSGEQWTYAVKIGLTSVALVYFWNAYSELRERVWTSADELVVTVLVGLAVLLVWVGIDHPVLRFSDREGFAPINASGQLQWAWVILRIAGSALVVPLIEELFWRSFLMRWIDQRNFLALPAKSVSWFAVLLTSAVFALEHNEWFAGLLAGLAYAWLYKHYNRLWPAIIAHAVTNLGLGVWIVYAREWTYW